MPARKPKPDEKPQFERFIETAREIGASETDEALELALEKITPPKDPRSRTSKVKIPHSS